MKWDPFKNRLKKESQQQEDAVDIDALWSAIEPDVDALNGEKGKRRRFFFWLFFGAGVALTAGWFALSNENVIVDGTATVNEKTIEERSVLSEDSNLNNNLIAESKERENESDLIGVNSNEFQKNEAVISLNSAKSENEKTIEDNEVVQIDQLVNLNKKANNSSVTGMKTKSKGTLTGKTQTNLKNLSADSERPYSEITSEKKSPNVPTSEEDESPSIISDNSSPSHLASRQVGTEDKGEEKAKIEETLNSKDSRNAISIKETTKQFKLNSLLATMQNGLLSAKSGSFSDVDTFSTKRDYMVVPLKSKFSFTAGLSAGLSYANRSLSQKGGDEGVLFQNRNKYESSMETSHYGFFIGAKHNKYNLGLTIGLQNTIIAERYTYKKSTEESEMVNGIQVRRINLEGDTIDVMGQILETTTTTIDKNIYNSYRLLDIPVILSYQLPLKKWNIGVEAGILVNLSLKTKGIVPNELLEIQGVLLRDRDQDIDNSKNDLFKSKVGLGYHFGLSLNGSLTKRLEWNVAPMLRIYPSDFAGTANPLSQHYVLYGLNGGVTYRF